LVWPKVRPILVDRAAALNGKIQPGLIEKWEEITGLEFQGSQYRVVLYYAGKKGPSWNNLSLEKNSAYYNHSDEHMLGMISHEIGIHVMLPVLEEYITKYLHEIPRIEKPGINGDVSYMAFESLAAFYNELVSDGKLHTGYDSNDYPFFKTLFGELLKEGASPLDMYIQAVKRHASVWEGGSVSEA